MMHGSDFQAGLGRSLRWAVPLAACLAVARMAGAQQVPDAAGGQDLQRVERLRELERLQLDTRERANPEIPVGQRVLADYGAYVQLSYLSLQDSVANTHGLREVDFYPYLRLNFDGAQEVFIRGRLGYRDFNTGDSFDGRGDEPVDGDIDRAYYRLDLGRLNSAYGRNILGARTSDFNLVFQGGRDFAYWANGLVLATTLDGINLTLDKGPFEFAIVAGVTPVRTVDIDTSRPKFDYNTRRGFYGGMASLKAGDHHPYVYGLLQRDYNQDEELTVGIIDTKFDYNSNYVGIGSTGALSDHLRYGVEFAWESGNTLSNSFEVTGLGGLVPVKQTRDGINAFGFDARIEYVAADTHETRLTGEFIAATGDSDRGSPTNTFNGNKPGTTDHGFNGFGLLDTGLAFGPEVSNVMVVRLGAATVPFPDHAFLNRLQVGTDFFILSKFQATAPVAEQTNDSRFLGFEPDVYLNWQMTSDLTLALRYGVFFPNERALGNDNTRQFFYGSLTFSF